MASYPELLQAFKQMAPASVLGLEGTPAFADIFNRWTADVEKELGVQGWDAIPIDQVGQLEFDEAGVGETSTTLPAEVGIANQILPGITKQIEGDVGRQAEVDAAGKQIGQDYGNLRDTLSRAEATFDGQAYFEKYPDVQQYYAQLPDGPNGGKIFNGQEMSPADFGKYHYDTYGRNEGRTPAFTSDVLRTNLADVDKTTNTLKTNAGTAATAQLTALQESIDKSKGILKGALKDQADALSETVTALQQNINTLTAEQRKALADEVAAKQKNLEQSIAAQQASLTQQISDLEGNASAAAAMRRQALEQQVAELTAAQVPVNEARLRGAEALTTAINIGLEETRDQLAADAAREGFVGPSTMTDAALVRATIGARQEAARAGAGARLENATDTREIGRLGAGGRYSIADAFATQKNAIGDAGAVGRGNLRTGLATGTQAIGDYGAGGERTIADAASGANSQLGVWNATTGYGNKDAGIRAGADIEGKGVTGGYDIRTALAKREQEAADQAATLKAAYNANLYPTSLQATQLKTQLGPAEIQAKGSILPYGTAGTNNALNSLNFWANNATPPASTAGITQPSTVGSDITKFSSGLTGAGLDLWKSTIRKPTTPAYGTPAYNAGKPGYDAYGNPTD